MGVGEPAMTLMRRTPAASIRWLSLAELRASHLQTLALDAADPILTSGANGLNAKPSTATRRATICVQRACQGRFGMAVRDHGRSHSAIAAAGAWSRRRRASATS